MFAQKNNNLWNLIASFFPQGKSISFPRKLPRMVPELPGISRFRHILKQLQTVPSHSGKEAASLPKIAVGISPGFRQLFQQLSSTPAKSEGMPSAISTTDPKNTLIIVLQHREGQTVYRLASLRVVEKEKGNAAGTPEKQSSLKAADTAGVSSLLQLSPSGAEKTPAVQDKISPNRITMPLSLPGSSEPGFLTLPASVVQGTSPHPISGTVEEPIQLTVPDAAGKVLQLEFTPGNSPVEKLEGAVHQWDFTGTTPLFSEENAPAVAQANNSVITTTAHPNSVSASPEITGVTEQSAELRTTTGKGSLSLSGRDTVSSNFNSGGTDLPKGTTQSGAFPDSSRSATESHPEPSQNRGRQTPGNSSGREPILTDSRSFTFRTVNPNSINTETEKHASGSPLPPLWTKGKAPQSGEFSAGQNFSGGTYSKPPQEPLVSPIPLSGAQPSPNVVEMPGGRPPSGKGIPQNPQNPESFQPPRSLFEIFVRTTPKFVSLEGTKSTSPSPQSAHFSPGEFLSQDWNPTAQPSGEAASSKTGGTEVSGKPPAHQTVFRFSTETGIPPENPVHPLPRNGFLTSEASPLQGTRNSTGGNTSPAQEVAPQQQKAPSGEENATRLQNNFHPGNQLQRETLESIPEIKRVPDSPDSNPTVRAQTFSSTVPRNTTSGALHLLFLSSEEWGESAGQSMPKAGIPHRNSFSPSGVSAEANPSGQFASSSSAGENPVHSSESPAFRPVSTSSPGKSETPPTPFPQTSSAGGVASPGIVSGNLTSSEPTSGVSIPVRENNRKSALKTSSVHPEKAEGTNHSTAPATREFKTELPRMFAPSSGTEEPLPAASPREEAPSAPEKEFSSPGSSEVHPPEAPQGEKTAPRTRESVHLPPKSEAVGFHPSPHRLASRTPRTVFPSSRANSLPQPMEIIRQVARSFHLALRNGVQEMFLELRPESLGMVKIQLTMQDEKLSGRVEVATPEAHRLMVQHLPELTQKLQEMHIQLERVEVQVMHQQAGDSRHQPSGQTPRQLPHAGKGNLAGEPAETNTTQKDSHKLKFHYSTFEYVA